MLHPPTGLETVDGRLARNRGDLPGSQFSRMGDPRQTPCLTGDPLKGIRPRSSALN